MKRNRSAATERGILRDPRTGMQVRIGVMGSAEEVAKSRIAASCRDLGGRIADRGCCLLTLLRNPMRRTRTYLAR